MRQVSQLGDVIEIVGFNSIPVHTEFEGKATQRFDFALLKRLAQQLPGLLRGWPFPDRSAHVGQQAAENDQRELMLFDEEEVFLSSAWWGAISVCLGGRAGNFSQIPVPEQ